VSAIDSAFDATILSPGPRSFLRFVQEVELSSRINEAALWSRVASEAGTIRNAISRRDFLNGSATGILAATTALDVLEHANRLFLETGQGWLSLRQGEVEKFRIESAWFGGNPQIWKEESADQLAFGIRNARFPGTSLRADLACEIWSGAFGPQVLLSLQSIGLSLRGFVRDWFDGEGLTGYLASAHSLVDRSDLSVSLNPGRAKFSANGILTFYGHRCATVGYSNLVFDCESLALQCNNPGSSILRNSPSRRTSICVARGSSVWPLNPLDDGWTYRSGDNDSIFDHLDIEAHESTSRNRVYAFHCPSQRRQSTDAARPA
jgi:hypothetical protein